MLRLLAGAVLFAGLAASQTIASTPTPAAAPPFDYFSSICAVVPCSAGDVLLQTFLGEVLPVPAVLDPSAGCLGSVPMGIPRGSSMSVFMLSLNVSPGTIPERITFASPFAPSNAAVVLIDAYGAATAIGSSVSSSAPDEYQVSFAWPPGISTANLVFGIFGAEDTVPIAYTMPSTTGDASVVISSGRCVSAASSGAFFDCTPAVTVVYSGCSASVVNPIPLGPVAAQSLSPPPDGLVPVDVMVPGTASTPSPSVAVPQMAMVGQSSALDPGTGWVVQVFGYDTVPMPIAPSASSCLGGVNLGAPGGVGAVSYFLIGVVGAPAVLTFASPVVPVQASAVLVAADGTLAEISYGFKSSSAGEYYMTLNWPAGLSGSNMAVAIAGVTDPIQIASLAPTELSDSMLAVSAGLCVSGSAAPFECTPAVTLMYNGCAQATDAFAAPVPTPPGSTRRIHTRTYAYVFG